MGYIRHHAIVITGWDIKKLNTLRAKVCQVINKEFASEIPDLDQNLLRDFAEHMVTPLIEAKVNGYASFFIGPDGSKEGWGSSNCGDESREKIIVLLRKARVNFAEICYGDEAGPARIINES